jgi:hypothetical protein
VATAFDPAYKRPTWSEECLAFCKIAESDYTAPPTPEASDEEESLNVEMN